MAPTPIARTQLSHVPLADPAGTAADIVNGNVIANSGSTIFRLKNTSGGTLNATFVPVTVVEDFTITHAVYAVAAGATVMLGKHDVQNFGANVLITNTAVTMLITAFEA